MISFLVSCKEEKPEFFQTNFLGQGELDMEYLIPEEYDGIPQSRRNSYINENYFDNGLNWLVGSDEVYSAEIQNMTYVCEAKSNPYVFYSHHNLFDENKNYEVEIAINEYTPTLLQNYAICALVIGYQYYSDKMLYFSIDNENAFFAGHYDNGWNNWRDKEFSDAIVNEGLNKLTVRKINNIFYFFVNEILVDEYQVKPIYDKNFGIVLNSHSQAIIQSFKIEYIE